MVVINHREDKLTIRDHAKKPPKNNALSALTSAALLLPLLSSASEAAENNTVEIQYSHYQEGKRDLVNVPNNRDPIEAETVHLGTRISLTDRIKLSFDYLQDTWSGATPVTTSPLAAGGNSPIRASSVSGVTTVGASPIITNQILLNQQLRPLKQDFLTGQIVGEDSQVVHVMSSASPETRKQGDFTLSYEWDEVALDIGGGLSLENDYESHYGYLGGRWDLNQKLTSLKLGLSYTSSDTAAIIDHDASPYLTKTAYKDQIEFRGGSEILQGNKQDWSTNFGLTQIINKDALLDLNVGYTHSVGYMENPYKATTVIFIDPDTIPSNPNSPITGSVQALLEQRPDTRNQVSLSGQYIHYIDPLDAAVHLSYQFSQDDWDISAHTFEAKWIQPLGEGWTVTPRIRYYSQSQANFYTSYLTSQQAFRKTAVDVQGREIWVDANNPDNGIEYFRDANFNLVDASGQPVDESLLNVRSKIVSFDFSQLPDNFSSDHRLAAYGALSGGVTVSKQFSRGVKLEAGFEYYQHASSLKLGGNGGGDFSDFDSYYANAALTVDLNAINLHSSSSTHGDHHPENHRGHTPIPAGVMTAHMLSAADKFMVGYRFMYGRKGGDVLQGTNKASDLSIVNNACSEAIKCRFIQPFMEMNMHMIHIMYAPTDWLNLMIMPQFVDMEMNLRELEGRPSAIFGTHEHTGIAGHTTGGIGDTQITSLFKLYEKENHHLHLGLGVNAPTGDVDLKFRRIAREEGSIVHFGMQLGSGTWDFLPNLTYTHQLDDWSWGSQLKAVIRMEDENESGYRLGDHFETSAWGGYKINNWFAASIRGVYSVQGSIEGDFNTFSGRVGSMDFPANHGGRFWDIGLGVNMTIPTGDLAGNHLSFEWLQPLEDDVNGYQLEREGALTATWSYAF